MTLDYWDRGRTETAKEAAPIPGVKPKTPYPPTKRTVRPGRKGQNMGLRLRAGDEALGSSCTRIVDRTGGC